MTKTETETESETESDSERVSENYDSLPNQKWKPKLN